MATAAYVFQNAELILISVGMILILGVCIAAVTAARFLKKRKTIGCKFVTGGEDPPLTLEACQEAFLKLAAQHTRTKARYCGYLMKSLTHLNYLRLHKVRRLLSETSSEIIELVPSARWLLGNYYDLHLGIKKIQSEIPRKIRLPVITEGSDKGLPRICAISCQLILKLGTRLSEENVTKMLKAYQKATPLTSEELWILQQALNLHLVENILSISGDIFKSINTKKTANDFVNARLQQISNTGDILRVLNMTEQLSYNNDVTFCSHVLYRLKNISLDETVLNKWASAVCPGLFEDPTPARIIAEERSNEAHLESMTRMLFTCLRLIKSFAYSDLFEAASPIEQILRHDPAGVYPMMNAKTRMRYRTELEKIARRRRLFQWELAEKILGLASAPAQKDLPHANHVGTYLIGQGRPLLISMLRGQRGPVKKQTTRSKNRTWLYFTFIAGLFGLFEYVLIKNLTLAGYELFGWVMFFFFCITVPLISGIAIELTNFLLTSLLPPKNLPGLDFLDGLPDEFRTLVVLPVLLGNPEQAVEYAQRLEKHYLANPQKNLFYAILGDFTDAPERCMPKDDSIVRAASQAIDQLNNKYFPQSPRFTVLMRYRRWNESEECWMGWERKRGKLEELNALLCGDTSTSYAVIAGNTNLAGRFKYVITLDGDTDLVRDCAAKLVGAAAHPLNQPIFDPNTNRITDGYAIIQPEVHNHLFSKDRSRFARVFACDSGLDTYSVITSDVYQDVCSEGIFVGKGIYDVAVVHRMLHKTFSENSVLSHDLIESCYVRCAFQSETVLLDNYPSSIEAYMRREHRWIRGDWQLLPWLFKKAPISRLSRWKITDNLRRSICPVCELALIFFCTVFVPQFVFMWVPIVLFRFSLVLTIRIVKTILSKIFCPQCRVLLVLFGAALLETIMQMMSSFILIPYRAWVAADAILRTLFRLIISHKKLLQWQASEAVEKVLSKTLFGYIRKMLPASCLGLALLTVVYFSPLQLGAKIALSLIALLWMLSPPAAYAMSRAVGSPQEKDQSGTDEEKTLRLHARRIWQYTVDFATAENNWLNPDNYQSYPVGKVANRTSPTNIGLQFLSLLTARDFGYIGLTDFVEACERLLSTVQALPKWNGHLYNWYNTNTLEVLNPGYVSTVDSGNFLCYALTLKNGLRELKNMPFDLNTAVKGINDTLALAGCELSLPETIASADAFYTAVRAVREQISAQGNNPWEDRFWIDALMHTCDSVLRDEFEYTGSGSRATTLPTVCETGIPVTGELADRIDRLIGILEELVRLTNFGMLYDQKQQLLYIGYRAYAQIPDDSHYDLAASEAIQTSFLAIAKGDIPLRHWKHLGRPLTLVHGLPAFVSWSGTMFEYLMPGLIMNYHRDSTFAQSMVAAVRHQIDFSKKAKIPWGISESQYFCFDTQSNYQYKAFGIPRLRMEPGSDSGKVVSPYSTFLALPYAFRKAMRNLKRMESLGALGRYGLYEAIDYDSPDTDALKKYSVIKSFMAHHLGMSLAAINNRLNQNILRKRFHREPMIGAAESLLEEKRRSYVVTLARHGYSVDTKQSELDEQRQELRYVNRTDMLYPRVNWLSNGHYSMLLTSDGDGFSICRDKMLYRWRADMSASYGSYIYIKDTQTGKLWSAAYKPTCTVPDMYRVIFQLHKTEFERRDGDISTHTSVTISNSADLEIRKLQFSNNGKQKKELETTSYFEVAMNSQAADLAHPLFQKMFGEFEYIPEKSLLIYKRRSSASDSPEYLMHTVRLSALAVRKTEFETDRRSFLGRNRTTENPAALEGKAQLGSMPGFSLDPIMSMRSTFVVQPFSTATVSYITAVCGSRDEAIAICDTLEHETQIEDVFEQFRINSVLELKYLRLTSAQCNHYMDLIGTLFYPAKEFRGPQECMKRNWKDQSGLWRFGISGDNPIILLRVSSEENLQLISGVLNAYAYLRMNNISVDLILLNEQPDGYKRDLNRILYEMTSTLRTYDTGLKKPSLFILQAWQMAQPEIDLCLTTARLVITSKTGLFFREECARIEKKQSEMTPKQQEESPAAQTCAQKPDAIGLTGIKEFFNGCGGFVSGGKEYEIVIDSKTQPPAPWINVIANDSFGFLVSETGAGYTWSLNSRENKISSWSNDPVTDMPSEALYVRDDDTGDVFLPCCLGIAEKGHFIVRYGFGYSRFLSSGGSLDQDLTVFVPVDEPLRIWHLSLLNKRMTDRHLSITLYIELTLGVNRDTGSPYVLTGFEPENNCMTAKSIYNFHFRHQTVFLFSSESIASYTGDRAEFLGIGRTIHHPASIHTALTGTVGVGLDPCAAIRVSVTIPAGETKDVIFGLGESDHSQKIGELCKKYEEPAASADALTEVKEHWQKLLGKIRVTTDDRAMDILANGWLQYQALACRITARTALYQCGGAYGFRDQLQDVLAFLESDPAIAKKQIILAAEHQYPEGDVQHWWHPWTEQGVRTRISDDLLWLAYAVSHYVIVTEDTSILDLEVPYLAGPALEPGEAERMHSAQQTEERGSIYEHCLRALFYVKFGEHGLPLMGGGDWNDGMNKVGINGRGESVWLAWFVVTVCRAFARICQIRGDADNEDALRQLADSLEDSVETHAWDGEWYLRAYYDDGEKLGSSENHECRIDSISQSWSVLSGAGNPKRAQIALRSANSHLIQADDGISQLLDPPFNKTSKDPGYIKNYFPGMRENGGQYTHGSVWLAIANMMLKNRSTAYQLLSMLNPINKTFTPEGVKKYVREPYVLSADISAAPNYMGQGGWSWYTGSASWMYRAIVNWFLGIRREGRRLLIDPAVPTQFGSFLVQYRYESSVYSIKVNVSEMVRASLQRLVVDDVPMEGNSFLLVDDGKEHHVVFHLMCSYTIDPGDITDKHKNERSTSRDADYIRIT